MGIDTLMAYDANENRVTLTTKAGGIYYYVYDPTASIPAAVYEQGPSGRYVNVREPGGSLVSREMFDSGGARTAVRYYHFDGLGSTIALTNESGTITDTYKYDAWGNVTPGQNNSTTDNPYQYVGQLGYYTHYQEPTFDLLQLGVRFHDPEKGRFTQRDPVRDDLVNRYQYAADSPVLLDDPTGEAPRRMSDRQRWLNQCTNDCLAPTNNAPNPVPGMATSACGSAVAICGALARRAAITICGSGVALGGAAWSLANWFETLSECQSWCEERYRNNCRRLGRPPRLNEWGFDLDEFTWWRDQPRAEGPTCSGYMGDFIPY